MSEAPPKIKMLRLYASIYAKLRRDVAGAPLHEPNEFALAASEALNFQADFIEAQWRAGYV